jgi:4-hydroxybenzoate polyprenyltransferase
MKAPRKGHPLDYIFVLRPVLLVPVWTVFLRGAAFNSLPLPAPLSAQLVAMLVAAAWLFGAVYALNQCFDIDTDRANRKLHFLPLGLVSRGAAVYLYISLTAGALLVAGWISWKVLALCVAVAVLGYLYSAPPWRLKGRPFWALFANTTAHGTLVFLLGWSLTPRGGWAGLVASLPYFFAVGAIYILTTVPDVEGDRAAGKRTLSVHLGTHRAARWALGWYWAAVLVAFYNLDLLFLLAALPLIYLFVRSADGTPRRASAAVRWAVGSLSVAACVHYPWYLAVLAVGFLVTRRYYRWRFDLRYP